MDRSEARRFIAAVGMFDGVHKGHAHLLRQLKDEAAEHDLAPLVLTFARHPLSVLHPESAPAVLTGTGLRADLICRLGIDNIGILDFSPDDFRLCAAEFMDRIRNEFGVEALLMGFNNHIGSDRLTCQDLAADGMPVIGASRYPDLMVSSSAVRAAVVGNDFAKAEELLGHQFIIRGTVVGGHRIGRTIGFPTANVVPEDPAQLIPEDGVYAVTVRTDAGTYRGMANIGMRPTVGGTHRTLEVHLIGFEGDLYGQTVDIGFIRRLRGERRFPDLQALKAQLVNDCRAAMEG